jgi:hypothetical protein
MPAAGAAAGQPKARGAGTSLVDSSAMRTALALSLAASLCACHRPQPSPEYRQARDRHFEILASYPLDAYARPEMDEVLSLLERVPPDSLDAEAAASLRDKIVGERRAIAEERVRREKLIESAGKPSTWVAGPAGGAGGGPGGGGSGDAPPAGDAAVGQGGQGPARPPSQLAAGTPLAAFQKEQGGCFEAKAPARIGQREGKPLEGEAWGLKDDESCRKAHPAEVGRLALFADGKLVEVREAGEAKATPVTQAVKGVVGKDGTPVLPPGTKLPPGATLKWSPPPAGQQPQQPPPAQQKPPPGR